MFCSLLGLIGKMRRRGNGHPSIVIDFSLYSDSSITTTTALH